MKKVCLNCNTPLLGNFCSNCGQDAGTHKINSHFLWHEIQHGLLHVDKGLFFTIKELFIRPGHSIREFIDGKRVKHFKPLSLIIVLAGIYGFLSHYYKIDMFSSNIQISGSGDKYYYAKQTIDNITAWVTEHYAVVALLQLPIFALGTYLGFKKFGYNFPEHLVINSFLTAQRLILRLIAFPVFYFYNKTQGLRIATNLVDLISILLFIWALFQLFNRMSKRQRVWRTILSLFISFFIIMLLLVAIAAYFAKTLK